jgi:hypothetical protein
MSRFLIEYAMIQYRRLSIVTTHAISRSLFKQMTDTVLDAFTEELASHFRGNLHFMSNVSNIALIPSAFNVDWLTEYGNSSNDYVLRHVPRPFINSTCTCAVSSECREPLRIGPPNLWLPGLVIGCLPIRGVRMSTLECFYSNNCIKQILDHLDYNSAMDGSLPVDFIPPATLSDSFTPLNKTLESRFLPNTTVEHLISELFVERWYTESSYETYFSLCGPKKCHYMLVRRNDISTIVTSVLSFYGGLTLGWRVIIWNLIRIYRKLRTSHTVQSS